MSRTATAWWKIKNYDAIKKQLSVSFYSIYSLSSKACEHFQQQLHLGWLKEAILVADSCPLHLTAIVYVQPHRAVGNWSSQMLFISVRRDFSQVHAFAGFTVPTSTSTKKVRMHSCRGVQRRRLTPTQWWGQPYERECHASCSSSW